MKVVWTDEALRDLEQIADYTAAHHPSAAAGLEERLRVVLDRISRWPESARRSLERPGIRVVPLGRYPYKLFYRVAGDSLEILHLHHTARQPWDDAP